MKKKFLFLFFLIILLFIFFYKIENFLIGYANFFSKNNPSKNADAIVVLSGGAYTRIPKALELYQKGYSEKILLTSERLINKRVVRLRKPIEVLALDIAKDMKINATFQKVLSLKGGATSTFDEAYDLKEFSNERNFKHIIIVTDAFHTRRALNTFKKIFKDSEILVEVAKANNDIYNEKNWWKTDLGLQAYILEGFKYIIYFFSNKNISYIKNY